MPAALKIIQVFNQYLAPGGEEKSVARIAEDLEAAGHEVTRFWRKSAEWKQPGAPGKFKQPFLMWRNSEVLVALRNAHEAAHADVWVLHNVIPVVSLGIYGLARELNVSIFQWLHNYRPISPSGTLYAGPKLLQPDDPWIAWKESWHGGWNGRVLTAWLAWGYARLKRRGDFESVKAWVAVSDEVRRIFAQARWFPERLYTLRHSWHAQPKVNVVGDQGYFLFLGRIAETKGVRFLVDLWKDPALQKIELVIAGDGPIAAELRHQSPPNVRWVGHVEGEVKQKLKAGCRAILFPSIWPEPLSTVAYEAYEMNKPIVASELGGMPEVIVNGQTGFLLPASRRDVWLERVLQLSRTEGFSQTLGVQGREWLDREVSPRQWGEQFNAIVGKALNR